MSQTSAGILLFRQTPHLEVLLGHPGGPYWSRKDEAAWSIPKGLIDADEDPFRAALREFAEETGHQLNGDAITLTPVRQSGGKLVHAWAMQGDLEPLTLQSNLFEMEWPPRSGRRQAFPELDRVEWFRLERAEQKILRYQLPLLAELAAKLR